MDGASPWNGPSPRTAIAKSCEAAAYAQRADGLWIGLGRVVNRF